MHVPKTIYLSAGIFFIPALIAFNAIAFGQGPGDLLTSSLIGIVYYPAYLALIAVVRPHFKPHHAILPIGFIAIAEVMTLLPGLAPDEALGRIFAPLYPNVQLAVLGKSMVLLLSAGLAGTFLLVRPTLFRLVATVLAFAQCTVLVLFHLALFAWPFEGMTEGQDIDTRAIVQRDGSLLALCDGIATVCYAGNLDGAHGWALDAFRQTGQISAFLEDTAQWESVIHTWIENPSPEEIDRVDIATVFKRDADDLEILLKKEAPSHLYDALRTGAGVLIVAFHQTWITLALLILGRHGNYRFRRWRWQRDI